jgi:hypothetical protein
MLPETTTTARLSCNFYQAMVTIASDIHSIGYNGRHQRDHKLSYVHIPVSNTIDIDT